MQHMEFEPGYGLARSQVDALLILDWLIETAPDDRMQNLTSLYGDQPPETHANITAALSDLEARGWVNLITVDQKQEPVAFVPTSAGRRAANDIRERRGNLVERRRACRDALLRWIHEETVTKPGTVPSLGHFVLSGWSFYYAQPFTIDEFVDASRWLKAEGYIEGRDSHQRGIVRPSITAKGEKVVEQGRSVNIDEPAAVPAAVQFNVPGSNNVFQVHSPHASQQVTNQLTADARTQTINLADAIEQALPVLPDSAANLPADLRAAATQDDPSVLKRVLARVQTTLVDEGGTALGRSILVGAGALLGHFGMPIVT